MSFLMIQILFFNFIYSSSSQITPCPRFPVGSYVTQPLNIKSSGGYLDIRLDYRNRTNNENGDGMFFCYMFGNSQSPTLRIQPGDKILFGLTNNYYSGDDINNNNHNHHKNSDDNNSNTRPTINIEINMSNSNSCGSNQITSSSINVHFHGTHTSPACRRDEVIRTIINHGESFTYDLLIPKNQAPGLYFYHPHFHGTAESTMQGGASGVIVVEGIENIQPAVAGLPEQILVFRDNVLPSNQEDKPDAPAWDVSVNYIPIPFPDYTPALISMKPQQKQFWRIVNSAADLILNLQLEYDGVIQSFEIVSLDGVPITTKDGKNTPTLINSTNILLSPAGRVELIMIGPSENIKNATLSTLEVNTGPDGDNDPPRPLIKIIVSSNAPDPSFIIPNTTETRIGVGMRDLLQMKPQVSRLLFFSENLDDPENPIFFITVEGQQIALYNMSHPPAITTYQDTVEDWIIENRSREIHVFHIHQIHFLLLERNGLPVPSSQQNYLDNIDIDFWSGNQNDTYPSIKVRMDFTGDIVGKFVYHCHILEHEDKGMMAIIEVLASNSTKNDGNNNDNDNWNPWMIGTIILGISTIFFVVCLIYKTRQFSLKRKSMNKVSPQEQNFFTTNSSQQEPVLLLQERPLLGEN